MSEFYTYFKENMDGLGLPAPETLFGNIQTTVANASVILGQIDKFGKTVTLGELIGAGTKLETLGVIAACSAAFYVGAVIGSIAVAIGRSLAGGTTIADVMIVAQRYQLTRPWLIATLQQWPGIYRPETGTRNVYHHQAMLA
jgi:hypothetical protein